MSDNLNISGFVFVFENCEGLYVPTEYIKMVDMSNLAISYSRVAVNSIDRFEIYKDVSFIIDRRGLDLLKDRYNPNAGELDGFTDNDALKSSRLLSNDITQIIEVRSTRWIDSVDYYHSNLNPKEDYLYKNLVNPELTTHYVDYESEHDFSPNEYQSCVEKGDNISIVISKDDNYKSVAHTYLNQLER